MSQIPCQCCRQELPSTWVWWVCDACGFRICTSCLNKHTGPHGGGGFKCSQCAFGKMEQKTGGAR